MHGIPRALGCSAYLSVWREVGALCVEGLVVFVPSLPHHLLSTVYQCDRCLSYQGHGGSWLGCQVLPATSAVSILELATNSGSSRMSRAPNFHRLSESDEVVYLHLMLFTFFGLSVIQFWDNRAHNFKSALPYILGWFQITHPIGHFGKCYTTLCLSPQILHKHCIQCMHKFNLKSQVWFQTKIARPEVQLPLY